MPAPLPLPYSALSTDTVLRFIHSSDWQLGMPFLWAEGDSGARLRALRMQAIDTLGGLAEEHGAQFMIVAGDLFDANTISERIIVEACERIGALKMPVLVIPGNHDHGGPASVFHQDTFLRCKPQNLWPLLSKSVVPFDSFKVDVFAAPLLQRHSADDPAEHFSKELGTKSDYFRIGIAHGSIRRFDQSGDGTVYNLIDPGRAEAAQLDYLALGDWHGCEKISERCWYSGSPEPTNFRGNDSGKALLVEIEKPGASPTVTPITIAQSHWINKSVSLYGSDDVTGLARWTETLSQPRDTLLNLELKGSLGLAQLAELDQLHNDLRARLLHLRNKRSELHGQASSEEIQSIATDGYLRLAVDRLCDMEKDKHPQASRALQLLYHLKLKTC